MKNIMNEGRMFRVEMARDAEAILLLDQVWKNLSKSGMIKASILEKLDMFYEDYHKFVETYVRSERKRVGCHTYFDADGEVRLTETGELET